MLNDPHAEQKESGSDRQVSIEFVKGNDFRVIRADGAVGSVTPNGHIHFALYSERHAIPERFFHEVNQDGSLGGEITNAADTRHKIVRELEVDVFLTVPAAESIKDWLEHQIRESKKR